MEDDVFQLAAKAVNEHLDTRNLDVEAIRERIELRPDVLFTRKDDPFLIRFLRARKYDKDRAFQLLVDYNQFRRKHRSFFRSARTSNLRPVFTDGLPMVAPTRDHLGRTLIFLLAGNWRTSLYSFEDILRALHITMDYLIDSERTQLCGVVLVIDFTGWKLSDVQLLNKQHLADAVRMFQDCFPARFKGIHFLNQPWYVRATLTFLKPLLKEKTFSRIHYYGKHILRLRKHIPAEMIPREVGGEMEVEDKLWLYNALLERERAKEQDKRSRAHQEFDKKCKRLEFHRKECGLQE